MAGGWSSMLGRTFSDVWALERIDSTTSASYAGTYRWRAVLYEGDAWSNSLDARGGEADWGVCMMDISVF